MSGTEPGTGHTEASMEMGLPIEGYMMKDGKRDSHWLAMAEGQGEGGKERATVRDSYDQLGGAK